MPHADARLNPHGRQLLIDRVVHQGRPVAHVAHELGISRQIGYRWVRRWRTEGPAGLHDRSSRPRSSPNRTPAVVEDAICAARARDRSGPDVLGADLGVPARTVTRVLRRRGMPLLADLDPLTGQVIRASKATAVRYERDRPGELVHVDVKKLGRIPIKPHCPWQNGKVERLNRTLQTEWAYRQVFTTNAERAAALAPWLEHYNTRRRHSALGGLPPVSRLSLT